MLLLCSENYAEREKGNLSVLSVIFAGIIMLGGLAIKAASSWLSYKRSKAKTHVMEAL